MSMNFVGAARPLTPLGVSSALTAIDFHDSDLALIWAVIEVETASRTQGFGFLMDKRPQILFERHIFRKFTKGKFDAVAPDISGPPGGYGSNQYPRLEKALKLSEDNGLGVEPPLMSASWGLGQVMGFNHNLAGYSSARAMVRDMIQSEDHQLLGMTMFLRNSGLAAHLVNREWTAFALGYNGPAQADHKYDYNLERQYERFASGSLPDLTVRTAQAALLILGYSPGKIDGVIGPRSAKALAAYRLEQNIPSSDGLDSATYERLRRDVGW